MDIITNITNILDKIKIESNPNYTKVINAIKTILNNNKCMTENIKLKLQENIDNAYISKMNGLASTEPHKALISLYEKIIDTISSIGSDYIPYRHAMMMKSNFGSIITDIQKGKEITSIATIELSVPIEPIDPKIKSPIATRIFNSLLKSADPIKPHEPITTIDPVKATSHKDVKHNRFILIPNPFIVSKKGTAHKYLKYKKKYLELKNNLMV